MNAENVKWYVLHTQPGHENQAVENLKMVFKKNNLQDRLVEISIPVHDEVEEENGKQKVVQRKVCPSYIFIKMDYDNDMWMIITNTRGITGFAGPNGHPLPLTTEEAVKIGIETPEYASGDFEEGQKVKVTRGAIIGFIGTIEKVDRINKKLRVTVEMFGRPTPVDLDYISVEPYNEDN